MCLSLWGSFAKANFGSLEWILQKFKYIDFCFEMKLLLLLITESTILCFLVKNKVERMRIMLKQINHMWWSNFPLENAHFTQYKCFSRLSILSKFSMEVMQSVVSQNPEIPFCKKYGGLDIWFYFRSANIQTLSWKNSTVFERQIYIFVTFDVVPESVFYTFNECPNSKLLKRVMLSLYPLPSPSKFLED